MTQTSPTPDAPVAEPAETRYAPVTSGACLLGDGARAWGGVWWGRRKGALECLRSVLRVTPTPGRRSAARSVLGGLSPGESLRSLLDSVDAAWLK